VIKVSLLSNNAPIEEGAIADNSINDHPNFKNSEDQEESKEYDNEESVESNSGQI